MSRQAMQEPTFLILTALASGPQHGYAILAEAAQISGGEARLRAGTLYAALDRLRAEGAIDVDREEVVEGRLRRYYRLTPPGAAALAAEVARMRASASIADRRLKKLAAGGTTATARSRQSPGRWPGGPRRTGACGGI